MVLLMPLLMSSYAHYVELVEPADKRACIKCCDNNDDCPLSTGEFGCLSGKDGSYTSCLEDTSGCPKVIPGKYFNCV